MGLQNQLSDVSSESILVLATVLVARGVSYLHSLLFTILRILGFYHQLADAADANHYHDNPRFHTHPLHDVIGSGMSGLILMCEQIFLNRVYSQQQTGDSCAEDDQCAVCLNGFSREDHVRRLECCHVFHGDCFEGWLEQLNFTCPLCRKPLVADERVDGIRGRVSEDVLTWFAIH